MPSTFFSGPTQRIEITGRAPLHDEAGNVLLLDAQGRGTVYLAGGGGVALSAEALQGLRAGVPSLSGVMAGTLIERLGIGVTLLIAPGNNLPAPEVVQINDNLRFERNPDEAYGQRLERDGPGEPWRVTNNVVLCQTTSGFAALTNEELRRFNQPIVTPGGVIPPQGLPPLPIDRIDPSTPGYEAAPPPGPSIGTLPAAPPSTWQDMIIEQRNSEELGANLRAAGVKPPTDANGVEVPGYEPHHIVPSRAGDERMDAIRDKLIDLDVDLNDAANGVWLPSARSPDGSPEAYHPRLNNDLYNDAVIQELTNATTREQAISILADIAARLRTGDFPGVRPRP